MSSSRLTQFANFQVFAIAALFLAGCGDIKGTNTGASCTGSKVILYVHDTNIQRVCGCAEGAGTFTGGGIQCTVPVGTSVYFYYPAITVPHQVVMGIGATGLALGGGQLNGRHGAIIPCVTRQA